jgi:RNA 2',3'-cyclic 3'-phosphodiesterase
VRVFLAVDVDDETRVQLGRARDAMQGVLGTAPVPPRITWVRADAAHVTVRFIGNIPDESISSLQGALSSVTVRPFEVKWGVAGTFGGTRNPRVIWIAPTDGAGAFQALAHVVNSALDPIVGPGDARDFSPHLTLGRVRQAGRRVNWTQALGAIQWVPTVTQVAHIVLYQSHLSPKGPTYTALSSHG